VIWIRSVHHHFISNHIAFGSGVKAHLGNGTFKNLITVGIYRKCYRLSHLHLTYISLIHIAYNLHIVKVGNSVKVCHIHV